MRLKLAQAAFVMLALSGCNSNSICMFVPCDANYAVDVTNPCDVAVEVAEVDADTASELAKYPRTIAAGQTETLSQVGMFFDVVARPAGTEVWTVRVKWGDIPAGDDGLEVLELPADACVAG